MHCPLFYIRPRDIFFLVLLIHLFQTNVSQLIEAHSTIGNYTLQERTNMSEQPTKKTLYTESYSLFFYTSIRDYIIKIEGLFQFLHAHVQRTKQKLTYVRLLTFALCFAFLITFE